MKPRFLADEDLRHRIVTAVRRKSSEVRFTTIRELGATGLFDDAVLDLAWEQRLIVVTHDVNTMIQEAKQRLAAGKEIHGLIVAPQHHSDRVIVENLLVIWECSDFRFWRNRIEFIPL